ncbi:glycosyltransferase family 2 protein [Paenibacillaceae bacterium WGS1546]|uniref:glycosyltransferase family 2 protein n=1 Tax=Cohnella sp. WGS1546 TaxID=3366810 RepID=UPI00372D72AC
MSVVIPFYNDPYIQEAVDSALAQSYKPLEVVIVNDGSHRETERLRLYEKEANVLVVHRPNGGTAQALNTGVRAASGAYIAWLSSDDRFMKDKIERQVRYMRETGYAITHTGFRKIDAEGVAESRPVLLPAETMIQFYRSMLASNTVNGCTVMMTRSLFDRMGGFSEKFQYTHDYEFWLRTVLAGFPIGYLRQPLTEYRVHPGMGTVKHRKAIERELDSVRKTYIPRLQRLLDTLGDVAIFPNAARFSTIDS